MQTFICVACAADAAVLLGRRDGYDVFECCECVSQWRTPLLGHVPVPGATVSEASKYSGDWYHFAHQEMKGEPDYSTRFDHDYAVGQMRTRIIAELYSPRPDHRLVDVGCSNGGFVMAALDAGYNAFGIDPSAAMIDWAIRRKSELVGRVHQGDALPWSGCGVITYHDVLEHVRDPFVVIQDAAQRLAFNGVLVIETPDPACDEARAAGIHGKHIKPREHTMLLPEDVWRQMLRAAGLTVVMVATPVRQKLAIYARRES